MAFKKVKIYVGLVIFFANLLETKSVLITRNDLIGGWKVENKSGWLNEILNQFWPDIGERIRDRIAKPLEIGIRQKLEEKNFQEFTIEKIVVGAVPFRVEQYKINMFNNSKNDPIANGAATAMDFLINYEGDCKVWFSLLYAPGFIPFPTTKGAMENLKIKGTLRVVIQPSIDLMKICQQIEIYFLEIPSFSFSVTGVNYFMAGYVSYVKAIVREYILARIASTLVHPNKITIKP